MKKNKLVITLLQIILIIAGSVIIFNIFMNKNYNVIFDSKTPIKEDIVLVGKWVQNN